MSKTLHEQIKQKAQLPRMGFSRELHREGHFVITLDSQGKIELTRYPIQETHILVNPWLDDVLGLLDGCVVVDLKKLQELADLVKKIEPHDHQLEGPYYFQLILTKEEKQTLVELTEQREK